MNLLILSQFPVKKVVNNILKEVTNSSVNKVTKENMERAFFTVTDLEEFIGNYAQNRLNETVPKIAIRGKHAGK